MFPPIALTLIFTAATLGLSKKKECVSTGNALGSSSLLQRDHEFSRSTALKTQDETQSSSPLLPMVQRLVTNVSSDAHQVAVAFVSVDVKKMVSGQDCPCTWNPSFPCSIGGGRCSSRSNKAGCEANGGQFCGDPSPPLGGGDSACSCTWDPSYPCDIGGGECSSRSSKAGCEANGGTFCGDPAPTPSPLPPTPPFNGKLDTEMQAVLDEHNALRAKHSAPDLTWDEAMASEAQSWADKCAWGHSNAPGENIWAGSGSAFSGAAAVKSWYNELTNPGYNFSSPGTSEGTGHFTAVVWKSTTRLGCAMKVCTPLHPMDWNPGNFLVCQYSPAGNYPGGYAANVLATK